MKRLVLLIFLLLQTSVVLATVYPTDTFGIHKLCINDPWNAMNANPAYHGSATSTFPCHYDYAIVHVPTLLNEINGQILNSKVVVKLEIDPIDFNVFYTNFIDGFEFAFFILISLWILSVVGKYTLRLLGIDMKFK